MTLGAGLLAFDRSQQAAVAAAVGFVVAYLLGSVPVGWLLARKRLRDGLRELEADHEEPSSLRRSFSGTAWTSSSSEELVGVTADVVKVLLGATIGWHLVLEVAPPLFRRSIPFSAMSFTSNQVMSAWQSAGLWCGLAALAGHFAPPWLGFRGRGQGLAPALALALVYYPIGFLVGAVVFFAVLSAARVAAAVAAGLGAALVLAWYLWIVDGPRLWGVVTGPELGLWCVGLSGLIAARLLANRPA